MLQSMRLQKFGYDWANELNWQERMPSISRILAARTPETVWKAKRHYTGRWTSPLHSLEGVCYATEEDQRNSSRKNEETRPKCNRREMGRTQLLKETHSPRTHHKLLRIKWVQDGRQVILLWPWSSISRLNDTPRGTMTFSRHYQKTKKWAVAQFLEISIPSQNIWNNLPSY